jgi:osmotically-inducible protein OsmY
VPTRSVRAWRRRASTAAPSVKQRKRRRRSLARVHTPDAKARRTSHHFITGWHSVSAVGQDRDKGVVTLGGQVTSDNDKSQAESLAKSLAGAQVVANQIAVVPSGVEKEAKGGELRSGQRH